MPNSEVFEARREAQYRRLGTRTPCCVNCVETSPDCLELHHVAGRAYDSQTVILCRNCHRKQSEGQYDDPNTRGDADKEMFSIGRFLLGFARMLEAIAPRLAAFGTHLIDRASGESGDAS